MVELARKLRVDAASLPALAGLPAARQQLLSAAVDAAQARQRADLEAAIQNALRHVPVLLRRPVLKILRG